MVLRGATVLKATSAGAKTRSVQVCITVLGLGVLTLNLAGTATASTKHHHHHDTETDDESSSRREARLHRLAKREKAAWRTHVAKVRDMSPEEREILRRHQHRAKIMQMLAEENAIDEERLRHAEAGDSGDPKPHHRHHHASPDDDSDSTPVRHRRHADDDQDADSTPRHRHHHSEEASDDGDSTPRRHHRHSDDEAESTPRRHRHTNDEADSDSRPTRRHLARLREEHNERLAEHNARLARILAVRHARLAKLEAAHEARLAARAKQVAAEALSHNARNAAKLAAKAKEAVKGSNYVALHGDDSAGKAIYFWQTVASAIPVKVITVDLNNANVKVSAVMSKNGDGTSEPFKQMIQRANPNVAVTGTFFSLDNLKPVGDIVIDGSLVHFGGMGTALCVTPTNHADMVTCQWGRHHDWTSYDFVCACGPRLLCKSRIVLDPHAERFKDAHMLAPNSRIAVGITPGNKLVFAMTRQPIYLGRMAKVMQSLGCAEAMNLDAGTSTGFYYNGAILARPGRKLTNMIVVYGRKDRYEQAIPQLAPTTYRRSDRSSRRFLAPAAPVTPSAPPVTSSVETDSHLAAFNAAKPAK